MTKFEYEEKLRKCGEVIEAARRACERGAGDVKFVPDLSTQQGVRLYYYLKREGRL